MNLKEYIATVADFPKEGILFRDITPLMANGEAFKYACDQMVDFAKKVNADVIVGPESRGFIFGCPVAYACNIGFIPIRKPNKLPRKTVSIQYELEYGSNELHMHEDAVKKGQKVLVIDDLLATGGTVKATIELIEQLGATVVGAAFLIELSDLHGREMMSDYPILSLMKFNDE